MRQTYMYAKNPLRRQTLKGDKHYNAANSIRTGI